MDLPILPNFSSRPTRPDLPILGDAFAAHADVHIDPSQRPTVKLELVHRASPDATTARASAAIDRILDALATDCTESHDGAILLAVGTSLSHALGELAEYLPESIVHRLDGESGARAELNALAARTWRWRTELANDRRTGLATAVARQIDVWSDVRADVMRCMSRVAPLLRVSERKLRDMRLDLERLEVGREVARAHAATMLCCIGLRSRTRASEGALAFLVGFVDALAAHPSTAYLHARDREHIRIARARVHTAASAPDDRELTDRAWSLVESALRTVETPEPGDTW